MTPMTRHSSQHIDAFVVFQNKFRILFNMFPNIVLVLLCEFFIVTVQHKLY